MREHDEHIRLYTPILQRIIVLVAVIIAVPVVLWTITAFVRAYIGPPQLPTFRPMAAVPAPPATPNVQVPNVQVAIQTANTTIATDARAALIEIKKPSDPAMSAAVGAAVAPAADTPALAPAPPPPPAPAQIAAVPPPPFAAANPNSGASTSKMPATVAAPPGIAPASIAPASIAPASIAAANEAQPAAPAPAVAPAVAAPASSSAPAMAWPSPTAFNPSSPPNDTVASAEQATVVDDAANPPAGTALRGKIPLPPHRPKVAAKMATMADMTLATAAMPVAVPTPSRVPLPRARPATAPEPAPVETSYPAYDPAALH